ncbi:hypothetical protein J3R30DRAFT_568354 [Lentinula aciculospora]|uniref:Protein-S-isoprenylcysteine O-methyltransferase n=1 Tax=Lentinula aciculospora TaxID=153920 RepID=A0A9W9A8W5_9AGAR|nr:hypothetical protein J3R30DRAFT_568354 [Lentinula aciculospora]
MHYLTGIHISHAQRVEAIVATSTIVTIARLVQRQNKWFSKAEKEGGKITDRSNTFMGRLVTRVHAYAIMAAPLSYLAAVFSNKLEQPGWYTKASLNISTLDAAILTRIRIAAAVAFLGSVWCHEVILKELGKQFHFIAVRQNSNVVSTGPYAVVRHPLYTTLLGQLAIISVAYWSWVPLASLGICIGAFGYKMSLEVSHVVVRISRSVDVPFFFLCQEQLIEEDLTMRDAYREYKKKVPYKIIPYIW